jgi:hypothetical protein
MSGSPSLKMKLLRRLANANSDEPSEGFFYDDVPRLREGAGLSQR